MENLIIIYWDESFPPDEQTLRLRLQQEGLSSYAWSNGPGDIYPPHSHSYHKIIYVARGSITWVIGKEQREYETSAGDRLELPRGTLHAARVGSKGVTCLEAHLDG